ncbi:MAG: FAD-dependent oxidoreductase, partial [Bacteroidota bacterium]
MYNSKKSLWEKDVYPDAYNVIIVGGGIVGLNTAIELKEEDSNLEILIIERGFIPIGASTRNAGFACFGSPSEILADLEEQNEQEVIETIQMRWGGLKKLKQRVGSDNMSFKSNGSYELFDEETEELYQSASDQLNRLNSMLKYVIGENVFEHADHRIIDYGLKETRHLIFNKYEGQLHPGK